MAEMEKALKRLERAAARARKAEDDLAEARAQLRQALAEAKDEGASISELARRLGVSRQRVYALLNDSPGR
jgi:DNA invertase Pin-like site-specific DNA recombinase